MPRRNIRLQNLGHENNFIGEGPSKRLKMAETKISSMNWYEFDSKMARYKKGNGPFCD